MPETLTFAQSTDVSIQSTEGVKSLWIFTKISNMFANYTIHTKWRCMWKKMKQKVTYRCCVFCGRLSSGIWDTEVIRGKVLWQTTFLPGVTNSPLEATVVRSRCRFKIVQRQPEGQLYTPSVTTPTNRNNRHIRMAGSFILTRPLA